MTSLSTEQSSPAEENPAYKSRIKNNMKAAVAYTQRKPAKHRAEMATVLRALACTQGVETILDAPCGVGRATILLAQQGYQATGVDLGEAAVQVAKQQVAVAGVSATIEQANLEKLAYSNKAFDATLCFRLYHHFPNDEIRDRIVAELCRVSGKYVLISYLSPWSYTSIKRWLCAKLIGKLSYQHTTRLSDLAEKFGRNGFTLVKDIPQARFRHTLHLAVFKRHAG